MGDIDMVMNDNQMTKDEIAMTFVCITIVEHNISKAKDEIAKLNDEPTMLKGGFQRQRITLKG